jgi:hypothetical protein
MRSAPSVSYPVGPSFLRSLFYGAALALGWLVCALWAWVSQADSWSWVLLACLAVTLFALKALARPARGLLCWDGQVWHWNEEVQGLVHVRLDWQRGMLLEFRSDDSKGLWFWMESKARPADWNALRRAVWTPT